MMFRPFLPKEMISAEVIGSALHAPGQFCSTEVELPSRLLSTFLERPLIFLLFFRKFLKITLGWQLFFNIFNVLFE
jgi:hypothetical protein